MLLRNVKNTIALALVAAATLLSTGAKAETWSDTQGTAFSNAMVGAGYASQLGSLQKLDVTNCSGLPTYFGLNPAATYLGVWAPPSPGASAAPISGTAMQTCLIKNGQQPILFLRQDEAFVIFLDTPPEARYFGATAYMWDRMYNGTRTNVFASLGDTENNLTLGSVNSPVQGFRNNGYPSTSFFGSQAVIVYTANVTVRDQVVAQLAAQGIPQTAVTTVVIPANALNLGADAAASDTFALIHRYGVFANSQNSDAWIAAPKAKVYRLTPVSQVAGNAFATPTYASRITNQVPESQMTGLAASLRALVAAVIAKYPKSGATETVLGVSNTWKGLDCILNLSVCLSTAGAKPVGDNQDARYGNKGRNIRIGSSNPVFVVGVNHTVTGYTKYTSVAVVNSTTSKGLASISDPSYAGSAAVYLPTDPNASKLYVIEFARSCTGAKVPCLVLPTSGAGGLPSLDQARFVERAYLNPNGNNVGPDASMILDASMIVGTYL